MSLRIFMAGALLASLGGCESGGNKQADNDRDGTNMTVTAREPGDSKRPTAGKSAVDCTHLPPFVPLYGDARVETCVSGPGEPGHESGMVVYTTGALPAAVLAWYKEKATGDGLTEALSTAAIYSAREDGKRSVTAMVTTVKGATKVTVNWGRDI